MSIALSEFWTRLVHTGIVDAAGCQQVASDYSAANDGTPPSDASSLASYLVDSLVLTEFQARSILAETPPSIRFGNFVQTSDKPSMPLGHWLPVCSIGPSATGPRSGFLLRVPVAGLTDYLNQWLAAHAGIAAPTLQPFELYGSPGTDLEVFTKLAKGRSLSRLTQPKKKVDRLQAVNVGIAVADALTALHSRSMVHGEVRADRVWITSAGETILLRDPSGAPRPPRADQSLSWLNATESPGLYAAPEFADPNYVCTPSTDIYSLGCLLFQMIVGRAPVDAGTVEQEIAAQVATVPPELGEAVQQGEAGDPVLRVAAFAMAKNPAARFATTQQIADALSAVRTTLEQEAVQSAAPPATPDIAPVQPEPPPPPNASPKSTPRSKDPSKSKVRKRESDDTAASKSGIDSRLQQRKKRKQQSAKSSGIHSSGSKSAARRSAPKTKENKPEQPAATPPAPVRSDEPVAVPPAAATPVATPPAKTTPVQEPPIAQAPATAPGPSSAASPPVPPPPPEQAVSAPPLVEAAVATAEKSESTAKPVRRKRRRKKNNLPFILGVLSVPVLAMIIFLIATRPSPPEPKDRTRPPIPAKVPEVTSSYRNPSRVASNGTNRSASGTKPTQTASTHTTKSANGYQLVSQGSFLWAPPFPKDTKTASLDLLPIGPAVIVSARLGKVINDPVGQEMIRGLSPELADLIKQAATRSRVSVQEIDRCTVALHPGQSGWPDASLVIELSQSKTAKQLADLWQASSARTQDGSTIYAGEDPGGDAYYLGDSEKGALAPDAPVKRFAVGSVERMKSVAENEGGAIPLPRSLQKLWDQTSDQSHFVALITPNFLFADGREMLKTTAPELVDPLKLMLIPDFAGVLVSASTDKDRIYAEFRAVPSGTVTSNELMGKFRSAFESWPAWAEGFVVDAAPDRSWKLLATRLPQMMRFYIQHTRYGTDDDTVVASTYLPGNAATQISVATLLAMNTKPGMAPVAATSSGNGPMSVEEMLNRKMSIAFEQESLEFAILAIVDEFKQSLPAGSTMPPVRIIGSDLQKMGITQNQQIRDFKKTDQPLRTMLTDIVLGANPDKTATGADDPKQSLIWTVFDNPAVPGGKEILVTTRQAAEGKYDLPYEFSIEK